MAHYDCNHCGAGYWEEHADNCKDKTFYESLKINKAPPIGLRPKSIVDAERIQEIKEAIIRYVLADKEIPKEWQEELCNLRGSTF